MLGLLAGVLNGAAFGRDVVDFNDDDESACNTGHFIIALDVARFVPLAAFKAEIDRHVRDLRNSQRASRFRRDPAAGRAAPPAARGPAAPRRADAAGLVAQLDKLAAELGVKPLRER